MDTEATSAAIGDDEYLTTKQVAARLNISTATVRNLLKQGRISALSISQRCLRFSLGSIRAFESDTIK